MTQILNSLLQFLQQGITAIFRFVKLIWSWSTTQIESLMRVPWQDWPLWKQILLVIIIAGVVWALYRAAREFWDAGERVLLAFSTLLGALVRTLPSVAIAGLIAVGGLWILSNVNLDRITLPSFLQSNSPRQ